jgi:hypothetical protein
MALTAGCLAPPGEGGAAAQGALALEIEPDGSPERAPPILRLRLRRDGAPPDPADVYLVSGEVGSAHLGQLARGDISNALAERVVPAARWHSGDALVVAPLVALAPGSHALVHAPSRQVETLFVDEGDAVPLLGSIWPPEGAGAPGARAWWCGDRELPELALPVSLGDGVEATLGRGRDSLGVGAACVELRLPYDLEPGGELAPPPAVIAGGAVLARVEPVALRTDAPLAPLEALACTGGEVPIGPACGLVLDDRVRLTVPAAPLLWLLGWSLDGHAQPLEHVAPRAAGGSFWVHPLAPSAQVPIRWAAVDVAGQVLSGEALLATAAPMPHLVINEVLANPVGPEPTQEWIEIYNDGASPAALEGYVLEDIGGETLLPAGPLAPGAYALLVNDDYDPAFEYDTPPVEGTLVLRVGDLGKGGLNNQGEPLKLVGPDGQVVSRFPPLPKPKSGLGVRRRHPRSADDDPDAFTVGDPTPGAPNAP